MKRERVLVTGGANGIGRAIVERSRADGYEPIVIDLVGDGIRADLSDPKQTARALEAALRDGPITRLVNNVGVIRPGTVEDQTLEDFDRVMSLNLRCAMQCVQALLPGMKEAKFGRIVNMSSRAALGKELRTAYAASKAGLQGMARVWALELGQYGITANAVAARFGPNYLNAGIPLTARAHKPLSMPFRCGASVCPKTSRTPSPSYWMRAADSLPDRCCTSVAA